jgi:hypothetical protein
MFRLIYSEGDKVRKKTRMIPDTATIFSLGFLHVISTDVYTLFTLSVGGGGQQAIQW